MIEKIKTMDRPGYTGLPQVFIVCDVKGIRPSSNPSEMLPNLNTYQAQQVQVQQTMWQALES